MGMESILGAVAGPIIGGLIGSSASRQASSAQSDAAAQADATQRYMYDTTRADNAPFRQTGLDANNRLAYLMGLGQQDSGAAGLPNAIAGAFRPGLRSDGVGLAGIASNMMRPGGNTAQPAGQYGSLTRNFSQSDLNADPVYQNGLQFGLDQGTQGINRQAAANGSFLSGATLKALTRFGNDYGSTKANESYNRFNTNQANQYNRLAGLSGAGQQATNQVSAAGQNMANNVSASQIGAGNARASGYVGAANALSGAIGQGYNNWQNGQLMDRMYPQQPNYTAFNDMSGYNSDGTRSITGGR